MKSMRQSKKILGEISPQPSGQGVVCPSLIPSENKKSRACSNEELLQMAFLTIDCLCREMGSGDSLYLAIRRVESLLEKSSLSESKIEFFMKRLAQFTENSRSKNVFVQGGFF